MVEQTQEEDWANYRSEYADLLFELERPLSRLKACYQIDDEYDEGDGTRANRISKLYKYHKLIDYALVGHPNYLLKLAGNLYLGEFMPKDEALGLKIYHRLREVKQTRAKATLSLATCYYSQGKWQNIPGKLETAFKMVKELADEDDSLVSIFRTGANYLLGRGTEKNRDLAYQYLKKAEERGHILAIRFIAWYYWESKNILHKLKAIPIMLRYMYLYNREYRRDNLDDARVCG